MRSSLKTRGALAVFVVALYTLSGLLAQVDDRPPVSDPTKEILADLSEDERRGLRAAVSEIWHADEVEKRRQEMLEANLAYRKALQEEIGRMDVTPKVRAVLMRLLQSRFKAEGKADDEPQAGAGDRVRPSEYSREEREIVTNARLKAERVAAVIEAKRRLDGAVTARERNAAAGNFREVMRAAMEKADPRVRGILGKRDREVRPSDARPRVPADRRRPAVRD